MSKNSLRNKFYNIRQRPLPDILRAMVVYGQYRMRNAINRFHHLKNKNRTEHAWAKLLGLNDSCDHSLQIANWFYSDQMAIFPKGFQIAGNSKCSPEVEFLVDKAVEHYFDLLGSGWVNVKHPTKVEPRSSSRSETEIVASGAVLQKERMHAAISLIDSRSPLIKALNAYEPIDWQMDFKSGFRWSNNTWYLDIEPGSIRGVDIKVPWELSRFYHAGPMGVYWLQTQKQEIAEEFQLQIIDWIVGNPLYHGVNWRNAMEAGLRAANWLLGIGCYRAKQGLTSEFLLILQKSLYEHAYFIMLNLEKNLLGTSNHYLCNLLGLIAIGAATPWIPESDGWLLFGINELIKEICRQVHPDGSHFEGSTSYHRFITEIIFSCYMIVTSLPDSRRKRLSESLRLGNIGIKQWLHKPVREFSFEREEVFPGWFVERLSLMVDFIKDLSKTGRDLPQIGDNDSGRLFWLPVPLEMNGGKTKWKLNEHRDLLASAEAVLKAPSCIGNEKSDMCVNINQISKKVHENVSFYPHFGLAIYRNDPLYLVICCGTNGGNREASHAHNDKLSFELSLCGLEFIVDPGTYVYTPYPEERNYFRSTLSHNTVVFNGMEQNDITQNSLFKLPDRSAAKIIHIDHNSFLGRHVGYGFKSTRMFIVNDNVLQIIDWTDEVGGYCVLNLHPDVEFRDGALWRKNVKVTCKYYNISNVNIEPSLFSPRYGVKIDSKRVMMTRSGKTSLILLSWKQF